MTPAAITAAGAARARERARGTWRRFVCRAFGHEWRVVDAIIEAGLRAIVCLRCGRYRVVAK